MASAAHQLGVPQLADLADDVTGVEVDRLTEWFDVASAAAGALTLGGARLSDAIGPLAAGWTSPAPRAALIRQHDAVLAAVGIIRRQVDVAGDTAEILRHSRSLADSALSDAEGAVGRLGWTVGCDLLLWAAVHGGVAELTSIVAATVGRLTRLRSVNDEALHRLALALRADPREPLPPVVAPGAAFAPGAGATGPAGVAGSGSYAGAVDRANREQLLSDLQSEEVSTVLMALGVNAALADAGRDGTDAQLLVYESANSGSQGRAAIGLGDIGAADNVAAIAPGIGNAPVSMLDGVADARAVRAEAMRQAPDDVTSVIAWYGYDMPLSAFGGVPVDPGAVLGNSLAALSDANAQAGGTALVDDLRHLQQLAPANARWVGIGFSMGSTTMSSGAARGARLDDLVLLGSPGAGNAVASAEDYTHVSPEHTFVTSFDGDPVTNGETDVLAALVGASLGRVPSPAPFGPDPAGRSFGAQVVDVRSNNPDVSVDIRAGLPGDPLTGLLSSPAANEVTDLAAHHQQRNYLAGDSLRAVAAVVVGHYGDIPVKPGR
ncbi:alpha/beta hydrolase [Nakamurella sp. GG22]